MKRLILISATSLFLIAGCSSDGASDGGADAFTPVSTASYFPLAVGNQWTFSVTDLTTGARGMKIQSVEAMETMTGAKAGIEAFRLRSDKANGAHTLSWQQSTADGVLRHAEKTFDSAGVAKTDELYTPNKLRVDESSAHVSPGATYSTSYTEEVTDLATNMKTTISKNENWTVVAVNESVTVPAGTFPALRLSRTVVQTGVSKTYWFVRGVGKVREQGANQLEELNSHVVSE